MCIAILAQVTLHAFSLSCAGRACMVTRGLLPADSTLQDWRTADEALTWSGLAAECWQAVSAGLGQERVTNLVLLAALPPEVYRAAVEAARVVVTGGEPRPLTAIEKMQAALTFAAARARFGLPVLDVLALEHGL